MTTTTGDTSARTHGTRLADSGARPAHPGSRPASPGTRLASLDGLRGVAALIVVVYHLSLVARPFLDNRTTGDAWWWLTQTPLKLFTAGTESVLVFFVLSGVVVSLPALRAGFGWSGYYGGRMLRLYLPVWASLALAAVLIALLPRDVSAITQGAWIDRANAHTLSLRQLLEEASLWRATYDVNNVLWSLRWELVFSLALPLFVWAASRLRAHWHLAAALAIVVTVSGRLLHVDALVYLPVFFLGSLIAVRLPELLAWPPPRSFWTIATIASLGLLIASWLVRPIEGAISSEVLWGLSGVGAAGLVVVAIASPWARRMLSTAVPRWLGKVSFSLYLVQAPIIATLAFALGDERWKLIAALGVPLSLGAAWLFYRFVERPSHVLAKRVSARLNRKRSSYESTSTESTLPAGSRNHAMSGPWSGPEERAMPRSSVNSPS